MLDRSLDLDPNAEARAEALAYYGQRLTRRSITPEDVLFLASWNKTPARIAADLHCSVSYVEKVLAKARAA